MSGAETSIRLVERVEVGLDGALRVLEGVREEAQRRGVALAMVVCDLGGRVIAAQRMDGAQLLALDLARDKALTAVGFGAPTEAWAHPSAPGESDWGLSTALGGSIVVFAGGLPLEHDGVLVGGLGVSGSAAEVDRACAEAGVAATGLDPR